MLALLRDEHLARWVQHELAYLRQTLNLAWSVQELCTWARQASPAPRLLLVGLDELEAEELCALRRLRETAWPCALIALSRSRVMPALRQALSIEVVLTPPFVQDVFADLLAGR